MRTDRHSHLSSTSAFTCAGATHTEVLVLAVGVFAFDQVRSLQRNPGEQTSGSGVGEDGRRAAQSHVRLHVPDRQKSRDEDRSLYLYLICSVTLHNSCLSSIIIKHLLRHHGSSSAYSSIVSFKSAEMIPKSKSKAGSRLMPGSLIIISDQLNSPRLDPTQSHIHSTQ